ncbi:uroporphyrinogen-III synthase [Oleiharenicola lentus]|uniref:Uroporphyrinogen-III synthase n=1 Tax=Oleiharenicola lentus TaxID=2508720 RepID=A0A4Q1CBE5_9BACT|nr:uroporphyrinogen-III synthase [Oleiharenicola lentus]RXK56290.1 uroporphyrinogen-III synthase [Oleiharenicola lentus]
MADKKSLSGRRIAVTRPAGSAGEWRTRLEAHGAEVIDLPLIKVSKEVNLNTLAEVLQEMGSYEWVIFTSANGVKFFFDEFIRVHEDIRALGLVRLAAVGEATAAALRDLHLRVDLQPKKASGEELAKELIKRESMDSAKVLVVTGSRNREALVELLHEARTIVDQLQVYKTEETSLNADPVAGDFRAKGADAILFASPSAAQSFFDQAAALKLAPKARKPLAGSIGPTTTAAMKQLGLPVDFEAAEPSLDALVAALLKKI